RRRTTGRAGATACTTSTTRSSRWSWSASSTSSCAGATARPMPPPELSLRHALALGVLHGPAELLPISSSGHTELVPWLLGWSYADLDGELRKAFEVALHAGTAAALLLALRGEVGEAIGTPPARARSAALVAGSFVPPAIVGLAF